MKIIVAILLLCIMAVSPISSELTSLIVPLNDSDIPKEIKPLLKEGYRINFQGYEENLIEFICYDENSASLLLNEFLNSRGGYKIQEYDNFSYKGMSGYSFTSTWGKGYVLKEKNRVYVFNSPSENISNLNILLETKFGKAFPYLYLALLLIPIGLIFYKIIK
ncbi:MAG TPA: hypothetical protein PLI06_08360 [Methanofastidiosum sp.]|nr:hypothetical protein [Methanofastidiosum sp.]HNU61699.1 hypothetical protein [Methanofastidiosum sp.]HOI77603.1 hypothetical protein [Methanofastidiosum sp.]